MFLKVGCVYIIYIMNTELLENFMDAVEGGRVLEMGLSFNILNYIRTKFDVMSFDIGSSRFNYDINSNIKQNMLVRFPFIDSEFDGVICNNVLEFLGDKGYFIRELLRVCDGPVLLFERSFDVFPMEFFEERDNLFIMKISVDGRVVNIGQVAMEFAVRQDLSRLFYRPGGVLSKFNLLVPEDIKINCGILFQKIK